MEGRLLLDIVVRQSPSIFQLFSGKDEPLLVWRNAFFVLDFGLDILDGVRSLNLQGDGLSGQRFDKDLHTSTEPKYQMEGRLLLDIVVRQSPPIFQLFASEDKPLLVWRNAFLVLDLGFHILDGVRCLDL